MTDTSGRTSLRQFAFYDPDGCVWRTWPAISLWGSMPYSGTWPRRGSLRSGACFERPTWEPPTSAPGCSSLLPTPAAQEPGGTVEDYHERLRKADGRSSTFTPLSMLVRTLLPTPTARDHKDGAGTTWHPEKVKLPHTIGALLPTPVVNDSRGGRNMTANRKPGGSPNVRLGMTLTDWAWLRSHGASTSSPSNDGNTSSAELPLHPPTTEDD